MAWHAPLSGTTPVTTLASGDGILIGPAVTLSTIATAIDFGGTNHVAEIFGTVVSTGSDGIELGTTSSLQGHAIEIYAGAVVRGYGGNAVLAVGYGNKISNAGDVLGEERGIVSLQFATAAGASSLTNSGSIENLSSNLTTDGAVVRSGAHSFLLANSGVISSPGVSFRGSLGVDQVVNSGRMIGQIQLSDGNDRYSGASGRLSGALLAGGGNDIAIGGIDADRFEGGDGNDTLTGNSGGDILKGDAGNDILFGGLARDFFTGGAGNDTFRYTSRTQSTTEGSDVIYDFDDPAMGNDRIDLSALFGSKLVYRHAGAFTASGQVRIHDVSGTDVLVQVNTVGTLAADFAIRLKGTTLGSMSASDFVL